MKTLTTLFISLLLVPVLTSCSSDNESFQPVTENPVRQEDIQIPMESLTQIGAIAKEGYPKMIKKFENGILSYWAQYYYKPDGNLLKVNYSYPSSTSEIFSNVYQYNDEGKIVKMVGWDVFDYYWENGRIIKVEAYNGAWYGRYDIFYHYNDLGQIVQKLEVYYGTTPTSSQKFNYTYFSDGNLKSIEGYWDGNGSGTYQSYSETYFTGYIENRNLFLDLEIIPGQSELNQFPNSVAFRFGNDSFVDIFYNYKFDTLGRVIEQRNGNNRLVYEYY